METSQRVKIQWKNNNNKKKKQKTASSPARIWTCTPTFSSINSEASYHWAMQPLQRWNLKFNSLKYFSLPFTPCGGVFIMNSRICLRKNSINEYFKAISHYLRVYSLSGFIMAAQWTHPSSSSLLSLKFRSPFFQCQVFHGKDFQPPVESGTAVFAACCYLPQKYFVIRQRTVNRGWIKLALKAEKTGTHMTCWRHKKCRSANLRGSLWVCSLRLWHTVSASGIQSNCQCLACLEHYSMNRRDEIIYWHTFL